MLLSAVSVLVVAQSSSEIPEGLMNNPVYYRNDGFSIHNKPALSITPYNESRLHAFHNAYEVAHSLGDIHPGRCCRPVVDQSTFYSERNRVVLRHVTCVRCRSLVSPFQTNIYTFIAGI